MRWIALLVLVLSGCAEYRGAQARSAGALTLNCRAEKMTAENTTDAWLVRGCGRQATCDTEAGQWVCHEVIAEPREAPSVDGLLVSRLSVETGCPPSSIAVVASSQGASRL